MVDPRCAVGAFVKAKALHVTSNAECSRRYGAGKKDKWLVGVVKEVRVTVVERTNRRTRDVVVEFNLGALGTDFPKLALLIRWSIFSNF